MDEIKENTSRCNPKCCLPYWEWSIQLFMWIEMGMLIASFDSSEFLHFVLWTGLFAYPAYIITMLCSSTFQYLRNLNDHQTMNEKMAEYFQAPPSITFNATCYHYETRRVHAKDSKGVLSTHIEQVRVNTRHTSQQLRYYSAKDVSGLFFLNLKKGFSNKKGYIKLFLDKEINFADSVSYADYLSQKEIFWKENRFYDSHMDYSETRTISGFEEYNLVQINDYRPCFVGVGIYIAFVIIPFAQFYKLYIESLCMSQNYKVRKLVSTRNNLMTEDFASQYASFKPALNLNNQMHYYELNNTGIINGNYPVNIPTQTEIENAKQYEQFIPDYRVINIDGGSGVVQDLQNMNIDYNQPPSSLTNYAGDIAIPSNQIILPGQGLNQINFNNQNINVGYQTAGKKEINIDDDFNTPLI